MNHESSPRPPIIVLLIDDQPFVGLAIKRLLGSDTEITVHCCHAANEALDAAVSVRPSLILQDLVMADVDGVSLVTSFRSHAVTAYTPIVVLSDNDDLGNRERALA